ncbi:MAG: hypothetical protein K6F77_10675 [Lachnospiraceae bacterium]|nr:hypothetical protein [Lachnospiraceae bacterium]
MNIFKKFKFPSFSDILLAALGAVLCGLGCGFINFASYGMDSIGLFYDGIRNILKLSPSQIGTASYVVCIILSIFLWFADRKYVSVGSVIYILMYGAFANIGTIIWEKMIPDSNMYIRIVVALLGLLVLYIGLGIYIAIDIGVDAFTGVMLWICDVTKKDMKIVKVLFDIGLTLIGLLLGGTIGVVTVISILVGGVSIDFFTKKIRKIYFGRKIGKYKDEVK